MQQFFLNAWFPKEDNKALRLWYLLPFMYLYQFLFWLRKKLYQSGLIAVYASAVPVIVVGNISVGGTGKTPLVIYLVNYLKSKGFQPGVISRGYGGKIEAYPLLISSKTSADDAGDEPVLIYRRTGVPVVVDPKRGRGIALLSAEGACDVIVSDDGLQHFSMHRDLEIAVVDGERMFGNGYLLPVGPLRESAERLATVDMLVCNASGDKSKAYFRSHNLTNVYDMTFVASMLEPLPNTQLKTLPKQNTSVHAVAGIGNPERFFSSLQLLGFDVLRHSFDDHHTFLESDFDFGDDLLVVMTEKDAVKCETFSHQRLWYLPIEAELPDNFYKQIDSFLNIRNSGQHHAR